METKKSSKGLIVLVIVLIIFLLGALAHICYNKFYIANEEQNKVNKLEEKVKKQELEKEKLSEVMELYKSLTDGYNAYGLYFGKKQTIETVPVEQILPYVVYSYFNDKELYNYWNEDYRLNYEYKNKGDIVFNYDEDGRIQYDANPLTISKKEINKYFKNKFNTDRVLSIKGTKYCNNGKCHGYHSLPNSICLQYLYDVDSEKFYFGCPHNGAGSDMKITNKLIKYEIDGKNMYIYDKMIADVRYEYGSQYVQSITGEKPLIKIEQDLYSMKSSLKITSDVIKDLDVKAEDLNADYILKNYSEYLDTYKHTFKKADNGKYYWYSSEIVK